MRNTVASYGVTAVALVGLVTAAQAPPLVAMGQQDEQNGAADATWEVNSQDGYSLGVTLYVSQASFRATDACAASAVGAGADAPPGTQWARIPYSVRNSSTRGDTQNWRAVLSSFVLLQGESSALLDPHITDSSIDPGVCARLAARTSGYDEERGLLPDGSVNGTFTVGPIGDPHGYQIAFTPHPVSGLQVTRDAGTPPLFVDRPTDPNVSEDGTVRAHTPAELFTVMVSGALEVFDPPCRPTPGGAAIEVWIAGYRGRPKPREIEPSVDIERVARKAHRHGTNLVQVFILYKPEPGPELSYEFGSAVFKHEDGSKMWNSDGCTRVDSAREFRSDVEFFSE